MKQQALITAVALIIAVTTIQAQSVIQIKSTATELASKGINKGSRFYFGTNQDSDQKNKLTAILNLDVIQYFDLHDKYNSDLKKKLFKESEDYKSKLDELKAIKAEVLDKTFYLDFDPNFKYRNDQLKYNLETKDFYINTEIDFENKNKLSVPQFDQLTLTTRPGMGVSVKYRDYETQNGNRYSEERIYFKVGEEETALKIEENAMNVRIIFILKLVDTTEFFKSVLGMSFTEHLINSKLVNVIVYDGTTNETIRI